MIIRVDAQDSQQVVRLLEPENFRRLHVETENDDSKAVGEALEQVGAGFAGGSEDVLIRVDWLREEVELAEVTNGAAQFKAMLDYARRNGWMDDTRGSIRAHLQVSAG